MIGVILMVVGQRRWGVVGSLMRLTGVWRIVRMARRIGRLVRMLGALVGIMRAGLWSKGSASAHGPDRAIGWHTGNGGLGLWSSPAP